MSNSTKRVFISDVPKRPPYKKSKNERFGNLKGYSVADIEDLYSDEEEFDPLQDLDKG